MGREMISYILDSALDIYLKSLITTSLEPFQSKFQELDVTMAKIDELMALCRQILEKVDTVSSTLVDEIEDIKKVLEDDSDIDQAVELLTTASDKLSDMQTAVSNIIPDLPKSSDSPASPTPPVEIPPEQGTTPPTPVEFSPTEELPGGVSGSMSPRPEGEGEQDLASPGVTTPGTGGSASEVATPDQPLPVVQPVVDVAAPVDPTAPVEVVTKVDPDGQPVTISTDDDLI